MSPPLQPSPRSRSSSGSCVVASVRRGRRARPVGAAARAPPSWLLRPRHRRPRARGHPAARRRHDLAAAGDDRGRSPDGPRRLRRAGRAPTPPTRSASWPGPSTGWRRDLATVDRAAPRPGGHGLPRAAHPAGRRSAPRSRTSPTASPGGPGALGRAVDQARAARRPGRRTCSTSPASTPAWRRCASARSRSASCWTRWWPTWSPLAGRCASMSTVTRPTSTVHADPARLRQLVANAARQRGPAQPRRAAAVTVRCAVTEDRWRLEVDRPGPGGPARGPGARLRAVRDPDRDRRGGGGTGLGLAIARWVAELHGGTVRFVAPAAGHRRRAAPRRPATAEPSPDSDPLSPLRRHPSARHHR